MLRQLQKKFSKCSCCSYLPDSPDWNFPIEIAGHIDFATLSDTIYVSVLCIYTRSVAQLVERRSPKPKVAGSIPVTPAIILKYFLWD